MTVKERKLQSAAIDSSDTGSSSAVADSEEDAQSDMEQIRSDKVLAQQLQTELDKGEEPNKPEVEPMVTEVTPTEAELAAFEYDKRLETLSKEADRLMEFAKRAQDQAFAQNTTVVESENEKVAQERRDWYQAVASEARDKAVDAMSVLRMACSRVQPLAPVDAEPFTPVKAKSPEKERAASPTKIFVTEEELKTLRKRRGTARQLVQMALGDLDDAKAKYRGTEAGDTRLARAQLHVAEEQERFKLACLGVNQVKKTLENLLSLSPDSQLKKRKNKVRDQEEKEWKALEKRLMDKQDMTRTRGLIPSVCHLSECAYVRGNPSRRKV